jgi:hypothetical protein
MKWHGHLAHGVCTRTLRRGRKSNRGAIFQFNMKDRSAIYLSGCA